jgi:hypothetical protein
MPTHIYANDALTRIFAAPPSHPVASVSVIDEQNEIRNRLIADKILVPAPPVTPATKPPIAVPADTATFHRSACQIIGTHPIAFARVVADSADSDPRLVSALRVLLALPPATRDQVVKRSSRKKVANGRHAAR